MALILCLSAGGNPAADTLRYTYLLDTLVRHHHHCLFVGPTGTGKTVYVKKHLQAGLPQDEFVSLIVTFSAQTMSNMTQVCCPERPPATTRHSLNVTSPSRRLQAEC